MVSGKLSLGALLHFRDVIMSNVHLSGVVMLAIDMRESSLCQVEYGD